MTLFATKSKVQKLLKTKAGFRCFVIVVGNTQFRRLVGSQEWFSVINEEEEEVLEVAKYPRSKQPRKNAQGIRAIYPMTSEKCKTEGRQSY